MFAAAACLTLAAGLSACGGQPAGKAEFTEICMKRFGGDAEKCACYAGSIEAELPADAFARLAQGAYDNRAFSGSEWLPPDIRGQQAIMTAIDAARGKCLT
jgi:hypothetical protein